MKERITFPSVLLMPACVYLKLKVWADVVKSTHSYHSMFWFSWSATSICLSASAFAVKPRWSPFVNPVRNKSSSNRIKCNYNTYWNVEQNFSKEMQILYFIILTTLPYQRLWPVVSKTVCHRWPSGSTFFFFRIVSDMGIWTKYWFQYPTTIFVRPDIPAWTAFCPSNTQKAASFESVGKLRII